MAERGIPITFSFARFIKFVMTEIFPGGRLPSIEKVEEHSTKAGFTVTHIQSLQSDFAKTLDMWADVLEARKDEAIAIQSEEVYERYMKFLSGTARRFPDRLCRHQPVHAGKVSNSSSRTRTDGAPSNRLRAVCRAG